MTAEDEVPVWWHCPTCCPAHGSCERAHPKGAIWSASKPALSGTASLPPSVIGHDRDQPAPATNRPDGDLNPTYRLEGMEDEPADMDEQVLKELQSQPAPQPCTCVTDRLPGTLGHLPSCPAYPEPDPQPRGGGRP